MELLESIMYEDYVDEKVLAKDLAKKALCANLNKWGKSADNNILYITGHSGSGKSTMALGIADENTDVIHLDVYYDEVVDADRCAELDKCLKVNSVKAPNEIDVSKWNTVLVIPAFERCVEDFAKIQYYRGRKVIVEGVQIMDEGFNVREFYKGKPVIVMQTSRLASVNRRFKRDELGNVVTGFFRMGPKEFNKMVSRDDMWEAMLKEFIDITEVKKDGSVLKML